MKAQKGEKIEGTAKDWKFDAPYAFVRFYSDGTQWFQMGGGGPDQRVD